MFAPKSILTYLAQNVAFQLGSKCFSSQSTSLSLLDMLKAHAVGFYKIAIGMEELRAYAKLRSAVKVDASDRAKFEELLASMKQECKKLELHYTLAMVRSIEANYKNKVAETDTYFSKGYIESDLLHDLNTLDMSFSNELGSDLIFRIASNKNEYFEKDALFGSEVTNAFPSATDNIRNAGTCFAVEQWDASVFHLMKTLERALHALATKFSIPFEHETWNKVIEQIEKRVRSMDSSFGSDWKDKKKFYSEAASQFMFLKEAWRNYVTHVGDVYDEGKALSVLTHVRVVMQALAKGGLEESP